MSSRCKGDVFCRDPATMCSRVQSGGMKQQPHTLRASVLTTLIRAGLAYIPGYIFEPHLIDRGLHP